MALPRRALLSVLLAASLSLAPALALAWGVEGHQVIVLIALSRLKPKAAEGVTALLAGDADNSLTPHDPVSESTWADAWRGAGHKETASWHFADVEIDGPDLAAACPGAPSAPGEASHGAPDACVLQKVEEFVSELHAPGVSPEEKRTALKYLLHFVGDMTQPLHAADHHDRGGNCVLLNLGGPRTMNLHSYWDTAVVLDLGPDAASLAQRLESQITPELARTWIAGGPKAWLKDSFQVAESAVYTFPTPAGCNGAAPVSLPTGYAERARAAAALQLEKAGVRLAEVLNGAF